MHILDKYPRNLMNFTPWLEVYDAFVEERKYIEWLENKFVEMQDTIQQLRSPNITSEIGNLTIEIVEEKDNDNPR